MSDEKDVVSILWVPFHPMPAFVTLIAPPEFKVGLCLRISFPLSVFPIEGKYDFNTSLEYSVPTFKKIYTHIIRFFSREKAIYVIHLPLGVGAGTLVFSS